MEYEITNWRDIYLEFWVHNHRPWVIEPGYQRLNDLVSNKTCYPSFTCDNSFWSSIFSRSSRTKDEVWWHGSSCHIQMIPLYLAHWSLSLKRLSKPRGQMVSSWFSRYVSGYSLLILLGGIVLAATVYPVSTKSCLCVLYDCEIFICYILSHFECLIVFNSTDKYQSP